tara:strand:- start:11602 stop:11748 length:147 start_codon:yes stop_codon:yes gene_type:complete
MNDKNFIDEMRRLAFGTTDPSYYSLQEVFDELLQRSNDHYRLIVEKDR